MSYTYRDRDRDWDEPRSSVSVKRYVIPPEEGHHNAVVRRPAPDWDDHGGAVARYDDRDHYGREYRYTLCLVGPAGEPVIYSPSPVVFPWMGQY